MNNFANAADPAITSAFFQRYYLSLFQDVFFVLTDTDHKSGFKFQSALLARMYQLVELNVIQNPLFDPAVVSDPNMTNSVFLRGYATNLLQTAFPHLHKYGICLFSLSTVLNLSRSGRKSKHALVLSPSITMI